MAEKNQHQILKFLLTSKAIQINLKEKFTWSSGIKSPIYTDNRLIVSDVTARKYIENELAKLIKSKFPKVDFIVGTSTAGIPHAAYVSNILNLPMGYVRGSVKKHGMKNAIEGNFTNAKNIVIIEDLFSTGKSVQNVFNILKQKGYNILGIVSIFSYDLKSLKTNLKNINYYSLVLFNDLLIYMSENNLIKNEEKQQLNQFINTLQ